MRLLVTIRKAAVDTQRAGKLTVEGHGDPVVIRISGADLKDHGLP